MGIATQSVSNTGGVANFAVGNVTTDAVAAADTVINVGFAPRYFMWFNKTSMLKIEWMDGMATGTGYRSTAGGAQTLDVAPAGIGMGNAAAGTGGTVTIKAADIPASGSFTWMAWG